MIAFVTKSERFVIFSSLSSILHMKLKWLILFISIILCPFLKAQTNVMQISGTIIDKENERPVPFAKAILVKVSDSTITDFRGTDRQGNFNFQLPIDTFRLILNHYKYDELEFLLVGSKDNHTFELGEVNLPEKGQGLDEVVILAFKEPIYFKGDTLVYVADSFKTRPNAVVEDLLKRLPGVKVAKDGGITVQGKQVKKVLVDGDEFFGSDATLATRNLTASSVQTVEIYEKADDGAAAGDDKIQVLDLKLKDEAKTGYFGDIQLGSDFQKFHEGKILLNYFTSKQKISLFGLGANTLESALSWQDMNKYGLNHLNAYQYDSETDSWKQNEDQIISSGNGLPVLLKTGAYYNNKINNKWTVGANYTYTKQQLTSGTTSFNQYNFTDTTYSYSSKYESVRKTEQHVTNITIDYKIDSLKTISFAPKLSIQNDANDYTTLSDYKDSEGTSQRIGSNSVSTFKEGYNIKTPITYKQKFMKAERQLMLVNNFVLDRSNNNLSLFYEDRIPSINTPFLGIDQQKDGGGNITSNLFQATYVEPLTKEVSLIFKAEHFITSNKDYLYSYNPTNEGYTELDPLTTNSFRSLKNKTTLGIGLNFVRKKHNLYFRLNGSYFTSKNENLINSNTINQKRLFLFPSANYTLRKSSSQMFNARLSTSANLPNNTLLQPIYNNINPNRVYLGSPNLMPSYNMNWHSFYNIYKNSNNLYAYVSASTNYTANSYVSDITFDNDGRTYETYYNKSLLNGVYLNARTSLPIFKRIVSLSLDIDYNFQQTAGRINGLESIAKVNTIGPDVGLNVDLDFLYLGYSAGYNFFSRANSNAFTDRIYNQTWTQELEVEFYLPWKMDIGFQLKHTKYENLSQSYNISPLIMSARIAQSFGKNKDWTVTAQVHDMLNQNQSISRTNGINIISDTRSITIARYYLLKVEYKFNSMYKKNKKKDENALDSID